MRATMKLNAENLQATIIEFSYFSLFSSLFNSICPYILLSAKCQCLGVCVCVCVNVCVRIVYQHNNNSNNSHHHNSNRTFDEKEMNTPPESGTDYRAHKMSSNERPRATKKDIHTDIIVCILHLCIGKITTQELGM